MFKLNTPMLATLLVGAFATASFAQDSTTAPLADCNAQFTALDTDANGYLSETEAPREFARARVDAITMDADGLSKDVLLAQCDGAQWAQDQQIATAPLEGANSFTEEQARDRATSWNVTDVSALVLDETGVWRGMGKKDAADVSVAVDYKGNVITAPKS